MSAAVHVFYDVYMGWGHESLREIMHENAKKQDLDKGEVAVFLNRSWTACKILCPGNALLYYRSQSGAISIETLRCLPTLIGASRLGFKGNLESNVIKAFESKFGKSAKRLKVAYA